MEAASPGAGRRRIVVLTSTFPRWPGDTEPAFVLGLCRLLGRDFDVHVLAPHGPGLPVHDTIEGVRVTRYRYFLSRWERLAYDGGILSNLTRRPWRYLLIPFFLAGQLLATLRLVARERVDLIHAHWLIPQGLVAVAATALLRRRTPVLCTAHGGDLFGLRGAIASALKRWVVSRVSRLTVVSQAMAEHAAAQLGTPRRPEVIPMGTDLEDRFTPAREDVRKPTRLLFVGRLVEKKGLTHLLQAMPRVLQRYPDATLDVAGAGPEAEPARRLAEKLGVTHNVRFLGGIPNERLPVLYREAAVIVAPFVVAEGGDQEGFGLVLVEALGCECAVIAADLPAVRDIIIRDETGVLVPPGDPEALASAIVRLLDDPAEARRLARNGRRYVSGRYSWTAIGARYGALASELIGAGTTHR